VSDDPLEHRVVNRPSARIAQLGASRVYSGMSFDARTGVNVKARKIAPPMANA
jgi:hypothetical protein